MSNHYGGVFVWDPKDGRVLCVSDANHLDEVKMAGGMPANGETPEETAQREASEKLRTRVTESTLVFVEPISSRGEKHLRYFFLAEKISGALEKGATWEVEEKDASGRVTEKLTARWITLREFADRLFFKQYPAFGAVLAKIASRDMGFYNEYQDLLCRFPEPEDLGLDITG